MDALDSLKIVSSSPILLSMRKTLATQVIGYSGISHKHKVSFIFFYFYLLSTIGHGKCSVDAIFGAVKTAARQECLRRGYRNDIISADGLFDFIKTHKKSNGNTSNVIPMIVTTEDYDKVKNNNMLQSRWQKTKTIEGTQSNHDYRCDPTDKNFLFVRPHTSCDQFKRVRLTKKIIHFSCFEK